MKNIILISFNYQAKILVLHIFFAKSENRAENNEREREKERETNSRLTFFVNVEWHLKFVKIKPFLYFSNVISGSFGIP